MLIQKTFHDLPTKLDPQGRPIRIFVISPNVPDYPEAKFPGILYSDHQIQSVQSDVCQKASWFSGST